MAMRDPQTTANDWANRLAASTQKITDGINSVTQAPGQKAAAQADVWVQNTTAARPKWQRRVAAVTLQEWQQAAITKGVSRIGPGAQASVGKFADFMGQLQPHINSGLSNLRSRGDLETNIQRSADWIRHMAKFQRK